jgi:hypothetical protein
MTNASNDLTLDSGEPPLDTSNPRTSTPLSITQGRDFRQLEDK